MGDSSDSSPVGILLSMKYSDRYLFTHFRMIMITALMLWAMNGGHRQSAVCSLRKHLITQWLVSKPGRNLSHVSYLITKDHVLACIIKNISFNYRGIAFILELKQQYHCLTVLIAKCGISISVGHMVMHTCQISP